MKSNNINDIVNCVHCGTVRNLSEQTYCSQCGGRELWQSKPESQKNVVENLYDYLIQWGGQSMVHGFLLFFIGVPFALVLVLKFLGLLFGFEIIFHG